VEIRGLIRTQRRFDAFVDAIAVQAQIAADVAFQQSLAMPLHERGDFGDGYAADAHAAVVEVLDECLARQSQCDVYLLRPLQYTHEYVVIDMFPCHLVAETRTHNRYVCVFVPSETVVAGDGAHTRDVTIANERADLLHLN